MTFSLAGAPTWGHRISENLVLAMLVILWSRTQIPLFCYRREINTTKHIDRSGPVNLPSQERLHQRWVVFFFLFFLLFFSLFKGTGSSVGLVPRVLE